MLHGGKGQSLSVAFTPKDTTKYTKADKSVSINVQPQTPTIAWSDPPGITFGTPLGSRN